MKDMIWKQKKLISQHGDGDQKNKNHLMKKKRIGSRTISFSVILEISLKLPSI